MINPKTSAWFGLEDEESGRLVPMNETVWYVEDTLGLKTLDEQGKLHLISWPGNHLKLPKDGLERITKDFLSDDDSKLHVQFY